MIVEVCRRSCTDVLDGFKVIVATTVICLLPSLASEIPMFN